MKRSTKAPSQVRRVDHSRGLLAAANGALPERPHCNKRGQPRRCPLLVGRVGRTGFVTGLIQPRCRIEPIFVVGGEMKASFAVLLIARFMFVETNEEVYEQP